MLKIKRSKIKGISFGITSGIITTLGLMVGLHSGTHLKTVVLGGILTIAIADAFSDAIGMHISEEATKHSTKEIWESTIATLLTKFIFAMSFTVPVFLLNLAPAIYVNVVWGLLLLSFISYTIAKTEKIKPAYVIAEHVLITLVVISITHYVGKVISFIGA